jgi:hypothetical protein
VGTPFAIALDNPFEQVTDRELTGEPVAAAASIFERLEPHGRDQVLQHLTPSPTIAELCLVSSPRHSPSLCRAWRSTGCQSIAGVIGVPPIASSVVASS